MADEAPEGAPETTPAEDYDYGQEPAQPPQLQPAAEAEAAGSSPPSQPPHPAYLIREAQELGFGNDEIASMSTDQLGMLIQQINSQSRRQQRQAPPPQPQPQPQRRTAPQEQSFMDAEDEAELADLNPGIQKLFKKMAAKLKEQERTITQLQQLEVNKQNETRNEAADRLFVSKPEYAAHFGLGTGPKMAKATDEASRRFFENRLQVYRKAQALMGAGAADSWDEAMEDGLLLFLSKNGGAPAAAPASQRERDWNDGTVSRPTQRTPAPEPPGAKRAKNNVEKFLREQNIPFANNGEPVTADDFPD